MNLFFLTSPMQLINAMEARHHYGIEAEACVLILVPQRPVSLRQIEKIINPEMWGAVHTLPLFDQAAQQQWGRSKTDSHREVADWLRRSWRSRRRRRRVVQWVNAIAQRLHALERLFLGIYYRKLPRHLANIVTAREVVLLDDGAGTIVNNEQRRRRAFDPARQPWHRYIQDALTALFYGYDLRAIEHVTFFTTFDIAVADYDRKVSHSYPYLRSRAKAQPNTEAAYFLGQPLPEYGMVADAPYMDSLREINACFGGREVVYVAHRDEEACKLERVRAALGWRVEAFDLPIEYQLCFQGPLPSAIGGFFTSALETCHVIFGEQIDLTSFRIAERHLPKSYRAAHTRSVYDYYENERGMKVVRLTA